MMTLLSVLVLLSSFSHASSPSHATSTSTSHSTTTTSTSTTPPTPALFDDSLTRASSLKPGTASQWAASVGAISEPGFHADTLRDARLGLAGHAAEEELHAEGLGDHHVDEHPIPDHAEGHESVGDVDVYPIFEYYSTKLMDHAYFADRTEIEQTHTGGPRLDNQHWIFRGEVFYVTKTQEEGMVPLMSYFSINNGDHALTIDPNEFPENSGYRFQENLGYVWKSPKDAPEGVVPVNEYFNERDGDHAYSVNPKMDMDANAEESLEYSFVKIAFYARSTPFVGAADTHAHHSLEITGDDPIPEPDPPTETDKSPSFDWSKVQIKGLSPVQLYRYVEPRTGDTILTSNYDLLKEGAAAWKLDGFAGRGYAGDEVDTEPLHRYYNAKTDAHFYTMDGVDAPSTFGWEYLGVEIFAYREKPSGIATEGLVRLWNKFNGRFLYLLEDSEANRIAKAAEHGYEREVVACYVLLNLEKKEDTKGSEEHDANEAIEPTPADDHAADVAAEVAAEHAAH